MMRRGSSESASSLSSLGRGYTGHHAWGERGHWNCAGVASRSLEKHQGAAAGGAQNASATASREGRTRCVATRSATSPLMGSQSGQLPSTQAMINPSNGVVTIEDQIRTVDKVIKVCYPFQELQKYIYFC